jgi:hypothetical protein
MPIFGVFSFLEFQYLNRKVANYPKIVAGYVKCSKYLPKIFWWYWDKNWRKKIYNLEPPPIDPIGGCFWNMHLVEIFTEHDNILIEVYMVSLDNNLLFYIFSRFFGFNISQNKRRLTINCFIHSKLYCYQFLNIRDNNNNNNKKRFVLFFFFFEFPNFLFLQNIIQHVTILKFSRRFWNFLFTI